jgi:hypothetical protein
VAAERLLRHIRLELARDQGHPAGSTSHRYEFIAPINRDGHIDADAWKHTRERCRVKRVAADEQVEVGHLLHRPGGSWAFHYDVKGDARNDEAGYRFNEHRFAPGEYVSIKDQDGEMRTYLVKGVVDLD